MDEDEITIDMENPDESGEAIENFATPEWEGIENEEEIWHADILKKIRYQARLVADQSTPEYYHRRFDPFNNPDFPSIFKLPDMAGSITVAAIGPYHRSVPEHQLIITNAKKSRIVMFLQEHQDLDTVQFLRWALKEEERARSCYERGSLENMLQDSKDFAEMLLLDGCLVIFAIFLLRSSVRIDRKPSFLMARADGKEFIHLSADISFNRKQLKLELLMLDNQIPFFVVEQLYTELQASLFSGVVGNLEEIALSCFDDILPRWNYNKEFPKNTLHLLHLFHWSRSPRGKYKFRVTDFLIIKPESYIPSANELRESATVFKKQPSGGLLDLSFKCSMFGMRGEMSIPVLYLYEQSEIIFHNLIAFEQSHLKCGLSVTAFCICMAGLLQRKTDAKLLRKEGILSYTNKTDQEIVDLFKELVGEYKETFIPQDLLKLYKDVVTHYEIRRGGFIGEVMLQYFPSRLITISVIFGAIAFFAALGNIIHSVYRTYHPVRR